MIIIPNNPDYIPLIKHTVLTGNNDKTTGDMCFADTDLVRIPYDGYCLVNAVCTATGDGELFVPQVHHQDGRSSNVPVLHAGIRPDIQQMVNYKIPIHKGDTPRVKWDKATDTQMCITGYFFRGLNLKKINNPVALNTPDVTVFKQITSTSQNVLANTDLEDFPFGGILLLWASSSGITSTMQVMQKGHQTGNTFPIPTFNSGLAVDCSGDAPYQSYVPATGNPTVTITVNNSETISVCASLFIDWSTVSARLRSKLGY